MVSSFDNDSSETTQSWETLKQFFNLEHQIKGNKKYGIKYDGPLPTTYMIFDAQAAVKTKHSIARRMLQPPLCSEIHHFD